MLQEGWQYCNKEYEDSDEELLVDLVAADCSGIVRVEIAEMCIYISKSGGSEFFIYRYAAVFAVRHDSVRCSELFNDFSITSARPYLVVLFFQRPVSEK